MSVQIDVYVCLIICYFPLPGKQSSFGKGEVSAGLLSPIGLFVLTDKVAHLHPHLSGRIHPAGTGEFDPTGVDGNRLNVTQVSNP